MKILIACEYSGITRDAFAALGHDAWSCDIIQSDRGGQHIKTDVRNVLHDGWDMMVGHPPCQYLSFAAMRYWHQEGRAEKRELAMQFFMDLYNAPIPYIAIENPRGYPFQVFRKPDQEIHPYYFGETEQKRICLWLKNLPKLLHSSQNTLFFEKTHTDKPEPKYIDISGKPRYFTDGTWDKKLRSKSFESIAYAMAEQWSNYILLQNKKIAA